MIGKTLGHYQITEKLGAGGMGVVYKARDLHLDRFVALKILPPEKVADPDRKRRFVQEAKAASALNHPNIVTIHDITQEGGTDFIVMEYVDGKTLDQRIGHRGLRLNDVLKYAVEIADALAKAHSAGIVHRDLKPTNIMVNEDGVVKVLDFGLAKLTEWVQGDQFASTATIDDEGRPITEEGVIVGTVSYMSPEQAEGKKVDARSDIFSLGSVLYEMVTGQKAFQGTSKMSTLSAILHQEPKPVSGITLEIPSDLEKLINRCLRKDPAKRWQTMADLKVALDELKEDSDSGKLAAGAPVQRRSRSYLWLSMVLVAGAVLAVAAWLWLRSQRPSEPQAQMIPIPLTTYPGTEDTPSFSPDGTQVTFQWCTQAPDRNCDIYIKQIGVEPPSRLTTDPAEDFSPAWSPDGRFIAFLRRLSPNRVTLIVTPQRGAQEKGLGEFDEVQSAIPAGPHLAWTPDSKWLVIPCAKPDKAGVALFLVSVETGERRRLIDGGGYSPAFSPDGRVLAFAQAQDIAVLHLADGYAPQGAPKRLASVEAPLCLGLAWTRDGREIIFSAGTLAGTESSLANWTGGLWRVVASISANPSRISLPSENPYTPAVSQQGNRLAYVVPRSNTDIWKVDAQKPDTPVRLISSTRNEWNPEYSPDGKRIAFNSDRSGHDEIWVCYSDGLNCIQLTSFRGGVYGPHWSSDSQTIGFWAEVGGNADLYTISANGGVPRRLTTDPAWDKHPRWSRDGQSVYFVSNRSGRDEIFKMPAAGGEAVQITRNGGELAQESPDGKFLYYMKGWPSSCSVWKMPVGGGEEIRVLDSVHCFGQSAVREQGIYFFTPSDERGHSDIRLYEFATGETRKIVTIEQRIDYHIAVSRDGRTILYTQDEQIGSDLMLVENFR